MIILLSHVWSLLCNEQIFVPGLWAKAVIHTCCLCWRLSSPMKSPWFFHTFFPSPVVVRSLNSSPLELTSFFTPPNPLAFAQMLTPSTRFCFMTGCVLPGRPFAIELMNPHRVHFTSQEIKELQQVNHFMTWNLSCFCNSVAESELLIVFPFLLLQKINSSSNKIQVRDLQLVTR